jgi:hypothetical protein
LFGHSFYYDTYVPVSTLITVTLAISTPTIMYSTSIAPGSYNPLQVDRILTFTHTKTVSSDISFGIEVKIGAGTNYSMGSGCVQATNVDPIYCAVSDVLTGSPSI